MRMFFYNTQKRRLHTKPLALFCSDGYNSTGRARSGPDGFAAKELIV